jgi:thiosulfate sulfurtransferase
MVKQISPEEAGQLISSSAPIIIDVRDGDSFKQGCIIDAIQLSVPEMKDFCIKTPKHQPILVYCYHGVSSQSVAQHLCAQGFKEVYSLTGGYEKWQAYHHRTSDRTS